FMASLANDAVVPAIGFSCLPFLISLRSSSLRALLVIGVFGSFRAPLSDVEEADFSGGGGGGVGIP
ncbi:hypothetical protein, partial [Pectobacterium parvum]|uniref:hypothetical protein n=1 Tax=Pectobacterium parvum TaxID=2778550 RepID=UPI001CEFB0ED